MSNEFKIKKGLVVEGDARVTGAIFDSTNAPGTSGQVLTSTVTGTDWKSLAEISGVDGTGTANYLSKWADADTITNSIVYDNGTNVGIGTASPGYKLEVVGQVWAEDYYIQNSSGTGGTFRIDGYQDYLYFFGDSAAIAGYRFGSDAAGVKMQIGTNGNVGIGTTTPQTFLTLNGANVSYAGQLQIASNDFAQITFYTSAALTPGASNRKASLIYNIGSNTFEIANQITNGALILQGSDSGGGNVGIGTTSPGTKLQVDSGSVIASFRSVGSGENNKQIILSSGGDRSIIEASNASDGTDTALAFNTGSTERMRITGGNVGIGTTSPIDLLTLYATSQPILSLRDAGVNANYGGYIKGYGLSGAGGQINIGVIDNNTYRSGIEISEQLNTILFRTSTSATERMRITSGGNVGIGTTSPSTTLDVLGKIKIDVDGTYGGGYGTIGFGGTTNGYNRIFGNNSTGDGLFLASATGRGIYFRANGGSTDHMAIVSSGNVGIGTTSPSSKLHVEGGTVMATGGTSNGKNIQLYVNDSYGYLTTSAPKFYLDKEIRVAGGLIGSYNESLQLRTSGTTRMYIDNSSGNVGIGTTSPSAKLEVNGALFVGNHTGTVTPTDGIWIEAPTGVETQIQMYTFGGSIFSIKGNNTKANIGWGSGQDRFVNFVNAGTGDISVGIGTTSPGAKLDVIGTVRSYADAGNYGQIANGSFQALGAHGGTFMLDLDNTGTADLVNIKKSGSSRFYIKNDGNVGIGTTSPFAAGSSYKGLHIKNATGASLVLSNASHNNYIYSGSSTGELSIEASDSFRIRANGAERMRITSAGNVGIGTTSPGTKLQVEDSTPILTIKGTGSGEFGLKISDGGSSTAGITYSSVTGEQRIIGAQSYVFQTIYSGGSERMRITSAGNVGIGTTTPTRRLTVSNPANGDVALFTNTADADLLVNLTSGVTLLTPSTGTLAFGTSLTERMRITSAGNVGIGTTSPLYKLDVASGNSSSAFGLSLSGTARLKMYADGTYNYYTAQSGQSHRFTTSGGAEFLISNGGNVGIGTTSPGQKLDVAGNGAFTGTLYVGSNQTINGTNPLSFTGNGNGSTYTQTAIYANQNNTSGATSNGIFIERGRLTNSASAEIRNFIIGSRGGEIQWQLDGSGNSLQTGGAFIAGNVGIGTTAPANKLVVASNASPTNENTYAIAAASASDPAYKTVIGYDFTNDVGLIAAVRTGIGWRNISIPQGNLGIGTTSPGQKLDVNGNIRGGRLTSNDIVLINKGASDSIEQGSSVYLDGGSGSSYTQLQQGVGRFTIWGFNGGWSEKMTIRHSDGNVGIGTTSPSAKLEITSSATVPALILTSDGGNEQFKIRRYSNNNEQLILGFHSSDYAQIQAVEQGVSYRTLSLNPNGGNVGIGTTSPASKLDVQGYAGGITINTNGALSAGGQFISGAGEFASSSSGTDLNFRAGATHLMVLKTSGNVGIGTTSPGTKLQVAGTIRATGTTGSVDVDPLYGAFRFYNGSTFYGGFYNDAVLSAGNAVDLVSYVATGDYYIGSATTAKAVKVEQGGNVGIGTTSPTEKLDVSGAVNATSYSVGGTAGFTGTVNFPSNPPGSQILDFQGGLLVGVS